MSNVIVSSVPEPAVYPLSIVKGLTFDSIIFNLYDGQGVVFDLTGYTVYAEIRAKPEDPVIYDLNPTITNPTGGEITIPEIAFSATFVLSIGSFQWDLIMDDPSGDRQRYLTGVVDITDKITKSA